MHLVKLKRVNEPSQQIQLDRVQLEENQIGDDSVNVFLRSTNVFAVRFEENLNDSVEKLRMTNAVNEQRGDERLIRYVVRPEIVFEKTFFGDVLRIFVQHLNAVVEQVTVTICLSIHRGQVD